MNPLLTSVVAVSVFFSAFGRAQAPPPENAPSQNYPRVPALRDDVPILTANELNNLVAPIALYPDPLLGQVLAASTYPL